jgi:hypothetical protein
LIARVDNWLSIIHTFSNSSFLGYFSMMDGHLRK